MKSTFRMTVVGVVVVAAMMPLSGCTACSAVGYIYSGPAVVELDAPLPTDSSMSACFGEVCEPAELTRGDGQRWEIPQEPPFVGDGSLRDGAQRNLRVVVTDSSGTAISDAEYEIPVTVEPTGVFGQCPGPFSFEPVAIALPSSRGG